MPHRLFCLLAAIACMCLLVSGEPFTARGRHADLPAVAGTPVRVSGPSPLLPGCEGPAPAGRVYHNSVVEPILAIDPGNSLHLVSAWQQDRWATAGASGQVAAVSWDGGQTWNRSTATFSRCQGGAADSGTGYELLSDPWVTIAPNGDVYQMTVAFDNPQDPTGHNAMLVSKSPDGGQTWGAPITLIRDLTSEAFNDKNSITADPNNAKYVYAVWERYFPSEQATDTLDVEPAMFSRTTDGGQTWEPARAIVVPPAGAASGDVILVLPSGELLNVFTQSSQEDGKEAYDLEVVRSEDRGVTWSAPLSVARMNTVDLVDPFSTFTLRPTPDNIASAAVDRRTGAVYVTWTSGQFSGGKRSDIALASSSDGGRTWSSPVRINQTPGNALAFVPTIAVLDDGTVGVSYYDLRDNSPTQLGVLANHWLTFCRSICTAPSGWQEVPVAGPFDMQRAPYARGFFIGDYMGAVAARDAFGLLYVTTTPPSDPEITAAYFVTVTPR